MACICNNLISSPGEADVGFAEESTPVDWVSQGDTFMVRRLYDDAAKCYRIAGDIQKEKSSMAHSRAVKAVGLKNNPRAMKNEYITAAEEFIDCDLGPEIDKKAALCLQYAKEYELAGMAYEKCEEVRCPHCNSVNLKFIIIQSLQMKCCSL